jgi:hypothetical protein
MKPLFVWLDQVLDGAWPKLLGGAWLLAFM